MHDDDELGSWCSSCRCYDCQHVRTEERPERIEMFTVSPLALFFSVVVASAVTSAAITLLLR